MNSQDISLLWRLERIDRLCSKAETTNPRADGAGSFRYVDISSIDNQLKQIVDASVVENAEAPSRARQVIHAQDILVSTVRPNLNAVALVPDHLDGEICSTGFSVLRPIEDLLLPDFLFAWVRHPEFIGRLTQIARGAGYPAVSDSDVRSLQIPLPPLPEQERIVEILRAADELRQLRAQANQRAHDLLPALFHEIFGEITRDSYRYGRLDAVADVVSGVAKGRRLSSGEVVEVPYIRVANVQDGYLDLSEIKTINARPSEIETYRLQRHDVLLTEGGDFDKLGRGALWDHEIPDCIHQNHIFRVRLNQDEVRPQFFTQYLQTPFAKEYFLRAAKRTTNLASINLTQLRALPVPEIDDVDQDRFVAAAQQIGQIAIELDGAVQRIDDLFQSLLARAFTGELTVDWRAAHHDELAQAARERDENLGRKPATAMPAPEVEQSPLPPAQPQRAVHATLDSRTAALLAAAQARPAYFRPEELAEDCQLNRVQVESGLHVLAALGFVRQVQLDGQRLWRLVDAAAETVDTPQELAP